MITDFNTDNIKIINILKFWDYETKNYHTPDRNLYKKDIAIKIYRKNEDTRSYHYRWVKAIVIFINLLVLNKLFLTFNHSTKNNKFKEFVRAMISDSTIMKMIKISSTRGFLISFIELQTCNSYSMTSSPRIISFTTAV